MRQEAPHRENSISVDPRIEKILEGLIDLANKEFHPGLELSGNRDEIDAIMLSVNMLGEELHGYIRELEQSREQLVQSAKLASLGEMASGLSHELNNPLFILMGFSQMLGETLQHEHPAAFQAVKENIEAVENSAERLKIIIDNMRDFSRQSHHKTEPVDLNQIIHDSFLLLGQQLKLKQITPEFALTADPLIVQVDKIKMEQVLVNLITNARDAIEQRNGHSGGTIAVATHREQDTAVVTFRDNGCGMTPETKSKVFDAFFTTKDVGKGTGLGMSVSYGILRSFDATIVCESTPVEGSVFTIRIPAATHPSPRSTE